MRKLERDHVDSLQTRTWANPMSRVIVSSKEVSFSEARQDAVTEPDAMAN